LLFFFPFSFTIKGEEEKKEQKKVCSFTLFIVRKEKKDPFFSMHPLRNKKSKNRFEIHLSEQRNKRGSK